MPGRQSGQYDEEGMPSRCLSSHPPHRPTVQATSPLTRWHVMMALPCQHARAPHHTTA